MYLVAPRRPPPLRRLRPRPRRVPVVPPGSPSKLRIQRHEHLLAVLARDEPGPLLRDLDTPIISKHLLLEGISPNLGLAPAVGRVPLEAYSQPIIRPRQDVLLDVRGAVR